MGVFLLNLGEFYQNFKNVTKKLKILANIICRILQKLETFYHILKEFRQNLKNFIKIWRIIPKFEKFYKNLKNYTKIWKLFTEELKHFSKFWKVLHKIKEF